ncbi:hypothetical protein ACQPZ8_32335 [Actinomadura nitritigenes]|uniref:hypothetical protein n=1 Tax=Actinomadura nitritigenes TaxID=134602 RepID=UPI003D92A40F
MDLEDAGWRARFLIRDRDGKFPEVFAALLADASIQTVLTGVRMPRMNAVMERWVQTCRRELLDHTLIWNQRHLLHALHEFEKLLQPASASSGHRQRTPIEAAASTDQRTRPDRPPEHPKKTTAGRDPERVRTCRLTCKDEVFGRGSVGGPRMMRWMVERPTLLLGRQVGQRHLALGVATANGPPRRLGQLIFELVVPLGQRHALAGAQVLEVRLELSDHRQGLQEHPT